MEKAVTGVYQKKSNKQAYSYYVDLSPAFSTAKSFCRFSHLPFLVTKRKTYLQMEISLIHINIPLKSCNFYSVFRAVSVFPIS